MKKVYSADNMVMTGYIKSLLESSHIECMIKNQMLAGGIGEIPPLECWPEIWIMHDDDYNEAMEIVNSTAADRPVTNTFWKCSCGETIEGQFSACWSCGAERR